MLVAFLADRDRGRAGWSLTAFGGGDQLCAVEYADPQRKDRTKFGKCIPVGHAAPLMDTCERLAAHKCLKKG